MKFKNRMKRAATGLLALAMADSYTRYTLYK